MAVDAISNVNEIIVKMAAMAGTVSDAVREQERVVRALADAIPGVRGIYGGRLRNAYQVECLTANLIAINRRYKVHAGIKITDLE